MFKGSSRSEDGKTYQVHFTRDYSAFELIDGNRPINEGNVRRLVESINLNGYLMSPIFVNEKKQIIDGQHRFHAIKETLQEVPYIVLDGYNGKEMQILNQTGKNWATVDFLHYWVNEGRADYATCAQVYNKYKSAGVSLPTIIYHLGGEKASLKLDYGKGVRENIFNTGHWEVLDLEKSIGMLEFMLNLQPMHPEGFNKVPLPMAINFLESKYPDYFNKEDFYEKLKSRSNMLEYTTQWQKYVFDINSIYNQRRTGEKIFMNPESY